MGMADMSRWTEKYNNARQATEDQSDPAVEPPVETVLPESKPKRQWLSRLPRLNGFRVGAVALALIIAVGYLFVGWGNSLLDRPWTELTATEISANTYGGTNIETDPDLRDWQKYYWLFALLAGVWFVRVAYKQKSSCRDFVNKLFFVPIIGVDTHEQDAAADESANCEISEEQSDQGDKATTEKTEN